MIIIQHQAEYSLGGNPKRACLPGQANRQDLGLEEKICVLACSCPGNCDTITIHNYHVFNVIVFMSHATATPFTFFTYVAVIMYEFMSYGEHLNDSNASYSKGV